ncbi:hypothetical protein ZORO111903_11850 [Zobellia roscoffensis]
MVLELVVRIIYDFEWMINNLISMTVSTNIYWVISKVGRNQTDTVKSEQ